MEVWNTSALSVIWQGRDLLVTLGKDEAGMAKLKLWGVGEPGHPCGHASARRATAWQTAPSIRGRGVLQPAPGTLPTTGTCTATIRFPWC